MQDSVLRADIISSSLKDSEVRGVRTAAKAWRMGSPSTPTR